MRRPKACCCSLPQAVKIGVGSFFVQGIAWGNKHRVEKGGYRWEEEGVEEASSELRNLKRGEMLYNQDFIIIIGVFNQSVIKMMEN